MDGARGRRRHSARASLSWSTNTWRGGCPNCFSGRQRLAAARPKRRRSSSLILRSLARTSSSWSDRNPTEPTIIPRRTTIFGIAALPCFRLILSGFVGDYYETPVQTAHRLVRMTASIYMVFPHELSHPDSRRLRIDTVVSLSQLWLRASKLGLTRSRTASTGRHPFKA
jgi:hypothetical protein